MPALSRSYGGLRCIQLHSRAWPSLSRTTPLLPDTQTDPEQGKKTCVYLEVNKTLSLKSSFSLHQPCCLLPLCSTVDTLARSLCSKCVTNSSSTGQFCFKASAHVVSLGAHLPQDPAWWPQINARDVSHRPQPVLPVTFDAGSSSRLPQLTKTGG